MIQGEGTKPLPHAFDISLHGRGQPNVNAFVLYYDRLYETLVDGASPLVTHEELLWQIELMHAIHASARTGRSVTLAQPSAVEAEG